MPHEAAWTQTPNVLFLVQAGNVGVISALLDLHVDVNILFAEDVSVLSVACSMVRLLLF